MLGLPSESSYCHVYTLCVALHKSSQICSLRLTSNANLLTLEVLLDSK